jgi:hypothetical protein
MTLISTEIWKLETLRTEQSACLLPLQKMKGFLDTPVAVSPRRLGEGDIVLYARGYRPLLPY